MQHFFSMTYPFQSHFQVVNMWVIYGDMNWLVLSGSPSLSDLSGFLRGIPGAASSRGAAGDCSQRLQGRLWTLIRLKDKSRWFGFPTFVNSGTKCHYPRISWTGSWPFTWHVCIYLHISKYVLSSSAKLLDLFWFPMFASIWRQEISSVRLCQ